MKSKYLLPFKAVMSLLNVYNIQQRNNLNCIVVGRIVPNIIRSLLGLNWPTNVHCRSCSCSVAGTPSNTIQYIRVYNTIYTGVQYNIYGCTIQYIRVYNTIYTGVQYNIYCTHCVFLQGSICTSPYLLILTLHSSTEW